MWHIGCSCLFVQAESRIAHPHFELIRHDVVDRFMIEVDQIYHLACPASPPQYQSNPIKTVKTRHVLSTPF
jgi:UDP-glucuronate decarboxylase